MVMNNEYIIINKTDLLKELNKLEKRKDLFLTDEEWHNERGQEKMIKQVVSQSTPLIPEIEKAFESGFNKGFLTDEELESTLEDYISNLKLNI